MSKSWVQSADEARAWQGVEAFYYPQYVAKTSVIASLQREVRLEVRSVRGDGTAVLKGCNYSFYPIGTIVLGPLVGWKLPGEACGGSLGGTISYRYLYHREFPV
jgi:hypothetical protein